MFNKNIYKNTSRSNYSYSPKLETTQIFINSQMVKINSITFVQKNCISNENELFKQHKTVFYTRISPDGQYQNHIDYILCSQRWISSIQSAKTRLGADCGSASSVSVARGTQFSSLESFGPSATGEEWDKP